MTKISALNKVTKEVDLHGQRRLAIQLRQSGSTIAQVKATTGLSAPTIIALNKAYQSGGMEAVQSRKIGRPSKSEQEVSASSANQWGSAWTQLFETKTEEPWTFELIAQWINQLNKPENPRGDTSDRSKPINKRTAMRLFKEWGWLPTNPIPIKEAFLAEAAHNQLPAFSGGEYVLPLHNKNQPKYCLLYAQDRRGKLSWRFYKYPLIENHYVDFCQKMLKANPKGYALQLQFAGLKYTPALSTWLVKNVKKVLVKSASQNQSSDVINPVDQKISTPSRSIQSTIPPYLSSPHQRETAMSVDSKTLTHLQRLEAESIHIMREVVAEADKPVMLYSIGKDSAVMLHLALKAFYPAPPPFPLLHVDTGWKFKDMYAFRERMQQEYGFELLTHMNPDGLVQGINPFTHGSQIHTDVMKTQGLKQALDQHDFDVAFGGARRDEEKSRAKERIFSFRNSQHRWDPKQQRPELWSLYNTKKHKGESIRVFPISNWTELDIWQYIYLENIPIVPLYFAQERPVVERDGTLIMVDDERMPLASGEIPMIKRVRFRTLGCYPLTGAVESQASTLPEIIQEMLLTKTSERQGRVIDHDGAASMEKKKQEGYF
jgi:sulfate adenylyltransferase subunit 2